jgi:hypothetical protein
MLYIYFYNKKKYNMEIASALTERYQVGGDELCQMPFYKYDGKDPPSLYQSIQIRNN